MAGKNFSVMRGTYNARLEVLGGFVDSVESTARAAAAGTAKAAGGKQEGLREEVVNSSSYTPGRRAGSSSSSSGNMMEELATPWNAITSEVLESLPHIDDFLIQDFQRRILEEDLLDALKPEGDESEVEMVRQRELASPFAFVRRLMVEVDEEREREREREYRREGEEEMLEGVEGLG